MFVYFKKKEIAFYEINSFFDHKKEWAKYSELNKKIDKISERVNKIFLENFDNYKNLNWNLYKDYHYSIKIWHDTFDFHAKCLEDLIEKFQPEEMYFSSKSEFLIDSNLLISSSTNVIEILARDLKNIKIFYNSSSTKEFSNNKNLFSFGQPKYTIYQNLKKKNITFLKQKLSFWVNSLLKKFNYLSVGCDEIETYNQSKIKKNVKIINFNFENIVRQNSLNIEFENKIKKDKNLKSLFHFRKVDYFNLITKLFFEISFRSEFFYSEYLKYSKFVKKKKFKAIIFQSMSPFFYPVFIFRKIAQDFKIPYITWVHGGYFTNSNPGYDVVDFKLCKNHIGYGKYLTELVNSKTSSISIINKNVNYNVNHVGSFRFDKIHKKNQK